MALNPDGLPYRYVHATHDFGKSSKQKQGIVFHMAEGCNTVGYLSGGNVLRNVSSNFVVECDGEIVQMLPIQNTSGSINPRDVRRDNDEDGFWGRKFTRYYNDDILTGAANQRTISVECDGKARAKWTCCGKTFPPGLNPKQVDALVSLIKALRAKLPQELGVNGHRDFADYKACPGKADGTEAVLAAVGHGAEQAQPEPPPDPDPTVEELKATISSLRKQRAALRGQVEDLEDALALAAKDAQRSYRMLKPYLPPPNEG